MTFFKVPHHPNTSPSTADTQTFGTMHELLDFASYFAIHIYMYIYGTYSKSFFKEKIGVPWGTRRGLGSFSKPSFFKDFLFQGDVHAA